MIVFVFITFQLVSVSIIQFIVTFLQQYLIFACVIILHMLQHIQFIVAVLLYTKFILFLIVDYIATILYIHYYTQFIIAFLLAYVHLCLFIFSLLLYLLYSLQWHFCNSILYFLCNYTAHSIVYTVYSGCSSIQIELRSSIQSELRFSLIIIVATIATILYIKYCGQFFVIMFIIFQAICESLYLTVYSDISATVAYISLQ